jgi:DNA-binding transcriptional regulator/RsmH inhibitor MraZ
MIDKQGRINLTQELCELLNYTGGMKVWFVWEEESVFRLVPEADLCGDDKLIASARLDEKRRLFVPKSVREHYTSEAIVYGKSEDGYIYIRFLERVNATADLITRLIEKQEQLIKLLAEQQD